MDFQGASMGAAVTTWVIVAGLGALHPATADAEDFRILDQSGYARLSEDQRQEYLDWAQGMRERDKRCAEEAQALLVRETEWIGEADDLRQRLGLIHDRVVAKRDSLMKAAEVRSEDGGVH